MKKPTEQSEVGTSNLLEPGCLIVWSKRAKWGGTTPVQCTFLGYRGKESMRVKIGERERTVRVDNVSKL